VATVNHCRTVWHKSLGLSTVLGFPGDLDAVELLFGSLLVQAGAAMGRAGPHRDDAGPVGTRSFRQSFLASYARRISERLAEAARAAQRQAGADAPDRWPRGTTRSTRPPPGCFPTWPGPTRCRRPGARAGSPSGRPPTSAYRATLA